MNFLIIGGGIAAFESAVTIRNANKIANITVISKESIAPYRRPGLSDFPENIPAFEQFLIKNDKFYKDNNINLLLNTEALKIDRSRKVVLASNSIEYSYDKLILAIGGESFIPPIAGINIPEVMGYRNYNDAIKLRKLLDNGIKNIAILGGGVLGLELAESLIKRDCKVNVIETCPELLPRNLDYNGGLFFHSHLKTFDNLTLNLGCKLESIIKLNNGEIELNLGDKKIKSQLLIVSAGVFANTKLAKDAELNCNRGIIVNDFLQTNDPNIYAAGDVVEIDGKLQGLYLAAKNMGNIASNNAIGIEKYYQESKTPVRMQLFGTKIFSIGELSGAKAKEEQSANSYAKEFYNSDEKLIGAVLIGDISNAISIQKQISL